MISKAMELASKATLCVEGLYQLTVTGLTAVWLVPSIAYVTAHAAWSCQMPARLATMQATRTGCTLALCPLR